MYRARMALSGGRSMPPSKYNHTTRKSPSVRSFSLPLHSASLLPPQDSTEHQPLHGHSPHGGRFISSVGLGAVLKVRVRASRAVPRGAQEPQDIHSSERNRRGRGGARKQNSSVHADVPRHGNVWTSMRFAHDRNDRNLFPQRTS